MFKRVSQQTEQPISLATGFVLYALAVAAFTAAIFMSMAETQRHSFFTGATAAIGVYVLIGSLMNHYVLRRLVSYHPIYNTLERVVALKLQFLFGWPLRYPVLFLQRLIDRYL